MGMKYRQRLIEVDLAIAWILAHARREKWIWHGHISRLQLWWARRLLAACRAVIWIDAAAGTIRRFAHSVLGKEALGDTALVESLWMGVHARKNGLGL